MMTYVILCNDNNDASVKMPETYAITALGRFRND